MSRKTPHVALLIESSRSYGRELLKGIRRYISEHRPWSVYFERRSLKSPPPSWLKYWKGDGILSRTGSQEMAKAIKQTKAPTIELRSTHLLKSCPFVGVDNRELGRLVADHFLERGYQHFGVYEIKSEDYFSERSQNFVESLKQKGYACHVLQPFQESESPVKWEQQQDELARWLSQLPQPIAVMACTDQLGFWLLDACRRAEISVPEQVAVVGVENDESLCTLSMPQLSSVPIRGEEIGYQAAKMLDRLMQGKKPPKKPLLLAPADIIIRQSSDSIAVDDEILSRALKFIREHACNGATVDDILRNVPMSRSSMERQMRHFLNRSPNEEINRVKLQKVKQLLRETDLSLDNIARKSGFRHTQYLCTLFKKTFLQTPTEYRVVNQR